MKLLIIDRKIRKYVENETLSLIINELEKNNIEVKWLLLDPEINGDGRVKNNINFKDFECYKTSNVLKILNEEKPDTVLLLNDYDFIIRAFIPVSKRLGIPTILIFPSVIDDYLQKMDFSLIKNRVFDINIRKKQIAKNFIFMIKNFHYAGYGYIQLLKMIFSELITPFKHYIQWGNYGCDTIIVSGESWANKLQKSGIKSKIEITGHPRMDPIFNRVQKYKKKSIKDDMKHVVLMTTPLVEHGLIEKEKWSKIIKEIIRNCLKLDKIELKIKIHPTTEKIEKYEEILKDMKIDLPIFQKENLTEIISNSDIVITYGMSTGTFDGIFLEKPIIIYNPFKMSLDKLPFIREELVTELNDIQKLPELLTSIKPIENNKIEKFISKYLFKFDGKSGYRASKIILELISEHVKNS